MENEYQKILEYYFDLKAKNLSKSFLEKYWLGETEMLSFWVPIKNRIFCSESKDLPDLMFKKGFELIVQRGGILFTKEEYYALQNCMKIAGDKNFVLIENEFVRSTKEDFPHLRFKFPLDTTWEELNNEDENYPDISFETLFIMNKHFFVFGDSGKWGKYAACDYYHTPLDILGFNPELKILFNKYFQLSKEDEEILDWLPSSYRALIKKASIYPKDVPKF